MWNDMQVQSVQEHDLQLNASEISTILCECTMSSVEPS